MKIFTNSVLKIVALIAIVILFFIFIDRKKPVNKALREIALVQFNDSPLSELSKQGIIKGLTMNGMQEGKDFELKVSNAQGDISTLNLIMDGIVNDKPDLVFVTSTPVLQIAVRKIKDIPVVFTVVADPVLAGAGKSFTDHLPNITGVSTLGDYRGMVEMIRTVLPRTRKIGTIYSPGEANSVKNLSEFKKYAEAADIKVVTIPVAFCTEVPDATMSLISFQPELVCQIIDNLTAASFSSIIKVCQEKNVLTFGFISDQAEKGAALVISRDYVQAGIEAAMLAEKIFNGEKTDTIPFKYVSRTNIIVNPKVVAHYGINIPEDYFARENVIFLE